jgi:hypothetical protein
MGLCKVMLSISSETMPSCDDLQVELQLSHRLTGYLLLT